MKVTVCFGDTRVIVPCGDGELSVIELIKRAVNRYCKASNTDNPDDVIVHCLKTNEEYAILDIDDLVCDVCDDKDKLIAVYDERNKKTSTIDLPPDPADVDNNNIKFQDDDDNNRIHHHDEITSTYITSTLSDNDSGVAADSYGISSNQTSTHTSFNSTHTAFNSASRPPRGIQRKYQQNNKNASLRSSVSSNSPISSPELSRKQLSVPGFSRDLNRKSLSTNHPMLYSWIDQQDQFSGKYMDKSQNDHEAAEILSVQSSDSDVIQLDRRTSKIIDVRPYTTSEGREIGLVVHDVDEASGITEIQTADHITEINGQNITRLSNKDAMEVYSNALKDETMQIKRIRSHSFLKDKLNLQTKPSSLMLRNVPDSIIQASKEAPRPVPKLNDEEVSKEAAIEDPQSGSVDLTPIDSKKHIFTIDLSKGSDGLGFSVTSKDVATSKMRTFFIKNILNKGAAIIDGRLKSGDELLEVNGISVGNKSQQDIVKILRSAHGIVSLKIARLKSEMTEEEFNAIKGQDDTKSTRKSSTPSPSQQQQEEILTLTIPLTSITSVGLGISVKGKRTDKPNQDDGIFVKSVLKGGAAAKDGRLLAEDHLLCINDISLIGLSNDDAMSVLRTSMEAAIDKGTIRIIIGRPNCKKSTVHTNSTFSSGGTSPLVGECPIRGASPAFGNSPVRRSPVQENSPNRSPVSEQRSEFKRPESPKIDQSSGRRTPERFSPRLEMRRRRSSSGSTPPPLPPHPSDPDYDKDFEERNSQRGLTSKNFAVARNKSYFRAVHHNKHNHSHTCSDSDLIPMREPDYRRTVSVSSTEIPVIQKSRPVYIEQNGNLQNGDTRNSVRVSGVEKRELPLPSYEEAVRRKNSSSSYSSSRTSSESRSNNNNNFKVLPDKYFAVSKDERSVSQESHIPEKYILPNSSNKEHISRQNSHPLESKSTLDESSDNKIYRSTSITSQTSLDSILVGPHSLPFSRDGFGRLSISEKKGRGHIDAKQSAFYNKLKKFKSMEELRPSVSTVDDILMNEDTFGHLKKTESVDTLISKFDAEEQRQAFKRGDKFSTSTPWYSDQTPTVNGEPIQNQNSKHEEDRTGVQRRLGKKQKPRPKSCNLDDASVRNKMLNDSLKTALDKTSSQPDTHMLSSDDKKKKGLLKGITGLLKKNKKEKLKDSRVSSPDYRIESPTQNSQEALDDIVRNNHNSENTNRPLNSGEKCEIEDYNYKYFQADERQKELVQKKKDELKDRKKENKKQRIPKVRDSGPNSPPKYRSGYNTWNAHNASNMREKSKQFFKQNENGNQDSIRSSGRSINLQRQSSLPPRAKKDSLPEIHRIMPRAPSGPMYKSPEQKPRIIAHRHEHSDSYVSYNNTPFKNMNRVSSPFSKNKHQQRLENGKAYSTITELTKHGGSVKISHKAEI